MDTERISDPRQSLLDELEHKHKTGCTYPWPLFRRKHDSGKESFQNKFHAKKQIAALRTAASSHCLLEHQYARSCIFESEANRFFA